MRSCQKCHKFIRYKVASNKTFHYTLQCTRSNKCVGGGDPLVMALENRSVSLGGFTGNLFNIGLSSLHLTGHWWHYWWFIHKIVYIMPIWKDWQGTPKSVCTVMFMTCLLNRMIITEHCCRINQISIAPIFPHIQAQWRDSPISKIDKAVP